MLNQLNCPQSTLLFVSLTYSFIWCLLSSSTNLHLGLVVQIICWYACRQKRKHTASPVGQSLPASGLHPVAAVSLHMQMSQSCLYFDQGLQMLRQQRRVILLHCLTSPGI